MACLGIFYRWFMMQLNETFLLCVKMCVPIYVGVHACVYAHVCVHV